MFLINSNGSSSSNTTLIVCFVIAALIAIASLTYTFIKWKETKKISKECYEHKKIYTLDQIKLAYENKDDLYEEYEKQPCVILIYNKTKDKYYVAASDYPIRLVYEYIYLIPKDYSKDRRKHDILSDVEWGNEFEIIILKVPKNNQADIKSYFIKKYNSIKNGYNKKSNTPTKRSVES